MLGWLLNWLRSLPVSTDDLVGVDERAVENRLLDLKADWRTKAAAEGVALELSYRTLDKEIGSGNQTVIITEYTVVAEATAPGLPKHLELSFTDFDHWHWSLVDRDEIVRYASRSMGVRGGRVTSALELTGGHDADSAAASACAAAIDVASHLAAGGGQAVTRLADAVREAPDDLERLLLLVRHYADHPDAATVIDATTTPATPGLVRMVCAVARGELGAAVEAAHQGPVVPGEAAVAAWRYVLNAVRNADEPDLQPALDKAAILWAPEPILRSTLMRLERAGLVPDPEALLTRFRAGAIGAVGQLLLTEMGRSGDPLFEPPLLELAAELGHPLRDDALWALGGVGSRASVVALHDLAAYEPAVADALNRIKSRLSPDAHAGAGGLALAAPTAEEGDLSLAEDPGALSIEEP